MVCAKNVKKIVFKCLSLHPPKIGPCRMRRKREGRSILKIQSLPITGGREKKKKRRMDSIRYWGIVLLVGKGRKIPPHPTRENIFCFRCQNSLAMHVLYLHLEVRLCAPAGECLGANYNTPDDVIMQMLHLHSCISIYCHVNNTTGQGLEKIATVL